VRLGGGQNGQVIQSRRRIRPARSATLQDLDQGIEQEGEVLCNRWLASLSVERLSRDCRKPAIENLIAPIGQELGYCTQVRVAGD
jgi:hypothetical protein